MNKRPAFTLIELLVAVAILGLVVAAAMFSLDRVRSNARNLKRLDDIKQIQTALQAYFIDEHEYPPTISFGSEFVGSSSATVYMKLLPHNPTPRTDGACPGNDYSYETYQGGRSYKIEFCLSEPTGNLSAGIKCATPQGILNQECFVCGESTINYGGQEYDTAQIGTQCLLAENLNVGTAICDVGTTCATEPDDNFDYNDIEKYCYQNSSSQCDTWGALYTWPEQMGLPNKCKDGTYTVNYDDYYHHTYTHSSDPDCNFTTPVQGICPTGWHLMYYIHGQDGDYYYNDWKVLSNYLAVEGQGGSGTSVGGKIKHASPTYWAATNNCGTSVCNSSGFSALGTGFRGYSGNYSYQTVAAYYFTVLPWYGSSWVLSIWNSSADVGGGSYWGERNNAWPVRCVKDIEGIE